MVQHHADFYSIDTPMQVAGIEAGARLCICRLSDQSLWVHAPLEITDQDERDIRALGEVRTIVVPNNFHYLQVGEFARRFPEAAVYAPSILDDKLVEIPHQNLDETAGLWQDDFDVLLIDSAPEYHEWVFCHRASRTLILTDLSDNIVKPTNPIGKVVTGLMNVGNGLAPTRLLQADMTLGNSKKTRELIDTILTWDFDRVSVAHGEVVQTEGKAAFKAAYEWLNV